MAAVHPSRKASQPYRAQTHQPWGSDIIEASHEEALYTFGELCLFTLMWRPADFDAGLVGHCPVCYAGSQSRQAAAFGQATKRECLSCYGTTYEGGFRAQIIRPALLADRNHETNDDARGVTTVDSVMMETTGDFILRKGDYLFRYDNTRWQAEEKKEAVVRPGFGPPQAADSFSGTTSLHREEETTVAFRIPPVTPQILQTLLGTVGGFVVDDIRAKDQIAAGGYV